TAGRVWTDTTRTEPGGGGPESRSAGRFVRVAGAGAVEGGCAARTRSVGLPDRPPGMVSATGSGVLRRQEGTRQQHPPGWKEGGVGAYRAYSNSILRHAKK